MRVALITRQYGHDSIYAAVRRHLEFTGIETEDIVVEHELMQTSVVDPRADLYVLRTRSLAGFSAAAALSLAGARLLVPIDRERVVRNRFLVQQTLAAAGIPAPRGFIAARATDLAPLLRTVGPLIVKPHDTGAGKNVVVARSEEELPRDMQGPLFAQTYVEHTSADVKLYGIGPRLFAIRRRFPARTLAEKQGEPFMPTDEMMEIAARCRQAFGLDLFGLDLLETGRGPVVVDVNSTPGYKGVNGAPERIAELLGKHVRQAEES